MLKHTCAQGHLFNTAFNWAATKEQQNVLVYVMIKVCNNDYDILF